MSGENWGDWQGHYFDKVLGKNSSTGDGAITQTRQQFLDKYKDSIDSNGNFIPGKGNLYYDNENAGKVYDNLIGSHTNGSESYFAPEVNMDWIKDDRKAGYLQQHGVNPDTLLSAAALAAGGYGLYNSGLLGGAGAAPASVGAGGAAGGGLLSTLGGAASSIGGALAGNKGLGLLAGAALGAAAGGDTTTSASKDPWAPAQQYLKDNLATNARMQQYYQANPFSQEQKQAYQGLMDTNANGLSNAGNYNQIAQNFMGSNRGLMGQMPTLNTGVKADPVNWAAYSNIGKKA